MANFRVKPRGHQSFCLGCDAKGLPKLNPCHHPKRESKDCHSDSDDVAIVHCGLSHHIHSETKEEDCVHPIKKFHDGPRRDGNVLHICIRFFLYHGLMIFRSPTLEPLLLVLPQPSEIGFRSSSCASKNGNMSLRRDGLDHLERMRERSKRDSEDTF